MPANAITTYDSPPYTGANREDLDQIAYDLSPEKTPVMNLGKRGTAESTMFDWITDALGAPDPVGVVEGLTTTAVSPAAPSRLYNVTQINQRPVFITASQQKVKSAGDWGKVAREKARRISELKRDIESALLRVQARVDGTESGPLARQTRSLIHFIPQANAVGWTVPASATAAIGAFSGTPSTLDDDGVKLAMKQAFENGGMPTHMIVSPTNKELVSAFTGRVNSVLDMAKTTVQYDVTVIQTSFGSLKVLVDQFFPVGTATDDFTLLLDPDYYGIEWLRTIGTEKLAKTGDFDSWLTNCEWGIKVHNPLAHAGIGYDAGT